MMMPCRQLGLCLFILLHLEVATIAMAQTIGTQSPLQGQSSRVEFNKSMVYIISILIFIFFVLGFISVYTRRCVDSHLRAHIGYRNFPFVDSGRRGIPPHVINTFPTFIYSCVKGIKIGKGSLECAVCLNVFEEDETLRLIPICNHVFHSQCIDVWLGSHSTCPVCRADLLSKHGDKASVAIAIQGTGHESDEPNRRSELDHEMQNQATVGTTSFPGGDNRNRLPSSRSTGFRFSSLFSRSTRSTGHSSSPVQTPNEDHERFTLRLPEQARDQLVNPSPNRTQSCAALPGESCPRKAYRSGEEESETGGRWNENRFDEEERSDKWRLTLASSYFNRTGSRETDHLETDKETAF